VPDRVDNDRDLVPDLFVGTDMGEGGIAAQHPAVMDIHHAATDRFAELKPDSVEAPEHDASPACSPNSF
jgi:hypothetical protein